MGSYSHIIVISRDIIFIEDLLQKEKVQLDSSKKMLNLPSTLGAEAYDVFLHAKLDERGV